MENKNKAKSTKLRELQGYITENSVKKTLADIDVLLTKLQTLSADGLTEEFKRSYKVCFARVKNINRLLHSVDSCKPELAEDLDTLDSILKSAADKTIMDFKTVLHFDRMELLTAAKDLRTAADDFAKTLQQYNEDFAELDSAAGTCAEMQGAPTADPSLKIRISVISLLNSKEYDEIIMNAFNDRSVLLKNSYARHDDKIFNELVGYTQPPISVLLNGNPTYAKFCDLYNHLNNKMQREKVYSGSRYEKQQ
jgi:hypothetical protein